MAMLTDRKSDDRSWPGGRSAARVHAAGGVIMASRMLSEERG
jgi:hypothetical protein